MRWRSARDRPLPDRPGQSVQDQVSLAFSLLAGGPKSLLALVLEGLCALSESPTGGGNVTLGNSKQGEQAPLARPNLRVAPSA